MAGTVPFRHFWSVDCFSVQMKKGKLISQKKSFDLPLLIVVSILVVFGLIMVYDSSAVEAMRSFGDSYYYIKQQLIWTGLGLVSMIFFAGFDYRKLRSLALPMIIISFLLLFAPLIPGLGVSGGGAHRWFRIGLITFQPAEIIKLTSIIFLATLFEGRIRFFPFVTLLVLTVGVTAILQKDLGSSLVFVASSAILYFVAGGPLWHFLVTLPLAITSLLLLIFTSGYRSKRVLAFLDPFRDTQGFTYHISQVLIALGSGGLWGLGLGNSRQKFAYIPEVTTDSIFGVVGEEFGFLGSTILIILFMAVILRGIRISRYAPDNFGRILAMGLTSWLGVQAAINLSSMVALLPLTGVPLPFISYGGSALVANMTAVGILLNISRSVTS